VPAHGEEDPRAVIQLLDEIGSPATMASMGPRMFGGVIGGAFPAAPRTIPRVRVRDDAGIVCWRRKVLGQSAR
jgi:hypothetical protein